MTYNFKPREYEETSWCDLLICFILMTRKQVFSFVFSWTKELKCRFVWLEAGLFVWKSKEEQTDGVGSTQTEGGILGTYLAYSCAFLPSRWKHQLWWWLLNLFLTFLLKKRLLNLIVLHCFHPYSASTASLANQCMLINIF